MSPDVPVSPETPAADRRPVAAVDLGGTKVLAGVVDPDGTVRSRVKVRSTDFKDQPDALLDRIAGLVREAAQEAGVGLEQLGAVGMGVPGPLDTSRSVVSVAPNLGWENVAARAELEHRLPGLRVFLENDVRSAALAESRLGAGRGKTSMLAVFVGTGIGGGLVLNGRVYHGARGGAGEVGHMVVRAGGPRCPCGRRGCLEAMGARLAVARYVKQAVKEGKKTVLTKLVKHHDLDQLTSGDLAEAIQEHGDAVARRAARKSARYVGIAIGSLVNVLDPDLVVLGGGVVEALGEDYVLWAARTARPQILAESAASLPIVPSTLGDDAGLLGAALTAFEGRGDDAPLADAPLADAPR